MQRLCSWCGDLIPAGDAGQPVYGVCLPCTGRLLGGEGVPIQQIVDQFPFPVLVVDDDVKVSILNRRGQEILGVLPKKAAPRRGGELFGCVNAHLPGGCGRTIHCSGCALRRAVTITHRTRQPQNHIPATLRRGDPDHPSAIAFTLSTSMRGEAVLVKIDSLDW